MEKHSGFFARLFDFTFKEFITTNIISILFGIGFFLSALMAIVVIVMGFKADTCAGIGALVVSPIIFLLYLIFFRVYLEIICVLFRIHEDLKAIRGQKESGSE